MCPHSEQVCTAKYASTPYAHRTHVRRAKHASMYAQYVQMCITKYASMFAQYVEMFIAKYAGMYALHIVCKANLLIHHPAPSCTLC